MVLTLIAEVLSGETLITPGGAVDTATTCGLEAFTWDGWLLEFQEQQARSEQAAIEVRGQEVSPVASPTD